MRSWRLLCFFFALLSPAAHGADAPSVFLVVEPFRAAVPTEADEDLSRMLSSVLEFVVNDSDVIAVRRGLGTLVSSKGGGVVDSALPHYLIMRTTYSSVREDEVLLRLELLSDEGERRGDAGPEPARLSNIVKDMRRLAFAALEGYVGREASGAPRVRLGCFTADPQLQRLALVLSARLWTRLRDSASVDVVFDEMIGIDCDDEVFNEGDDSAIVVTGTVHGGDDGVRIRPALLVGPEALRIELSEVQAAASRISWLSDRVDWEVRHAIAEVNSLVQFRQLLSSGMVGLTMSEHQAAEIVAVAEEALLAERFYVANLLASRVLEAEVDATTLEFQLARFVRGMALRRLDRSYDALVDLELAENHPVVGQSAIQARAEVLLDRHQYVYAEALLRRILSSSAKPSSGVLWRLGVAEALQGREDDALSTFGRALAVPGITSGIEAAVRREMAIIYESMDEIEQVLAVLDPLVRASDFPEALAVDTAELLTGLARRELLRNRPRNAEAFGIRAFKLVSSPEVKVWLCRALLEQGKFSEVVEITTGLDPLSSSDTTREVLAALLNSRAFALRELGRRQEALDSLRSARVVLPLSLPVNLNLVTLLLEAHEGLEEEAYYVAREFASARASDPEAMMLLSRTSAAAGKYEMAIRAAASVLAIEKSNAEAYFVLGSSEYWQRNFDDAEVALLEAVAIEPARAAYWSNLSASQLELGKLTEARAAAMKAHELDELLAAPLSHLGYMAFLEGKKEESRNYFDLAALKDESYPGLFFNLGRVALRQGNRAEALEHLRHALRGRPALRRWLRADNTVAGGLNALEIESLEHAVGN